MGKSYSNSPSEIESVFNVKGKVVLVTGGGRGVGEHITEGFVANGAKVYITGRKQEALTKTCDRLNKLGPGECIGLPSDLSKPEGVKYLVEELKKREKELNVLVNNAGASWGASIEDVTLKSYDRVMDLNVKSMFFLTQGLLPLLKKAGSDYDPSRVINIGSVQGIHIGSNSIVYDISKAAVHHLTKVLGSQLTNDNVLVNAIALGLYETSMTGSSINAVGKELVYSSVPLKRPGRPEEIAGVCIFLSSKASGYMTGATISVDGGLHVGKSFL